MVSGMCWPIYGRRRGMKGTPALATPAAHPHPSRLLHQNLTGKPTQDER